MIVIKILLIGKALSILEFLLVMFGFTFVASLVVVLISDGVDKTKEIAKNIGVKIKQKKQENLLNQNIQISMREYQNSKNSFQYFSDDRLLNIYSQFQNGTKNLNLEQLALEEELVKRNLIEYSPMHEKLYKLNKEYFK